MPTAFEPRPMKRTTKPFVVERKRRAPDPAGPKSIWSDATVQTLRRLVSEDANADAMVERPTSEARGKEDASPAARSQASDQSKPRILEARIDPRPLVGQEASPPPLAHNRPKRRPAAAVSPPSEVASLTAQENFEEAVSPADGRAPPVKDSSATSTYSDRRREARKRMPPGQRWRWILRH